MSRLSVAALTTLPEETGYLEKMKSAAGKNRLAFVGNSGTYDELMDVVSGWTVLPEIIILDVPEGKDAFEALEDLGSRVPEGSGDVILTGVSNDIMTYRTLMRQGVTEVFPEDPDHEEMSAVIENIAERELRGTEIDPRRAVYVWSASGGSGGTSFALAFAKHLSRNGQRTLLIDMDVYSAPASYMFKCKESAQETYGLVEALVAPDRVDAVFLERAIQKVDKNLFYLSSRKKRDDKDFSPRALSVLVSRAQKNFDVVVVDTPWRGEPAPDFGKVNGISFIVAAPGATSYLGFATIAKELAATASKAPVFGIINKAGEFKSNDFTKKMFSELMDGEIFEVPYDPAATGKMFFAQKTLLDVGGKIARPLPKILGNLPSKTTGGTDRVRVEASKPVKKSGGGLSSLFGGGKKK